MTNNELLGAISDMMDTKLEPINSRLDRIDQTQKNDILPRLESLEQSQKGLEQSQKGLEQSYERLEQSQRKMELTLENNILPRLQTIEDCYLSTFERYQSGVGQIETMQNDIDVIKTTVTKHSEILQKLA